MAVNSFSNMLQKVDDKDELIQGQLETSQMQENKTGLPDNLKSGMEQLSGQSLDHVKVHYNSNNWGNNWGPQLF